MAASRRTRSIGYAIRCRVGLRRVCGRNQAVFPSLEEIFVNLDHAVRADCLHANSILDHQTREAIPVDENHA